MDDSIDAFHGCRQTGRISDIARRLLIWEVREEAAAASFSQQQADPVLARIPVVVMTGAADRDQEALAVDAAGYFLKPYNVTALLDLIATYCQETGYAPADKVMR